MLPSCQLRNTVKTNAICTNNKPQNQAIILRGVRKKLQKATPSSVMSVQLPVLTWRISMKFDIWVFLENLSRNSSLIKIEQYSVLDMKNTNFWSYLAQFFLVWEMLQTKHAEEIKTRILRSINPPPDNRAGYEITWKNIAEPGRPQMIIWRMRIASFIPKATNTRSECTTYCRILLPATRQDVDKVKLQPELVYTGCPGRNVPDFGRVFLKLKYTDITQNTYIQSWTVTEIMAREVWKYGSCYTLIDYQIHIKTGRNMWFL